LILRHVIIALALVPPCLACNPQDEKPAEQSKPTPDPKLVWTLPAVTAMDSRIPANGPVTTPTLATPSPGAPPVKQPPRNGVRWGGVFSQSALFLLVEQGYRVGTQPGTRDALKGPFFEDWFKSVKATHGWGDGDDFLTNYIGHPMQGSVTGFIFTQNDPAGKAHEFGKSSKYWKSRLKGMAWSAIYSTQLELGPISEASIGNVGYHDGSLSGAVDLVVTPLAGFGWQIGEDALDRYVVQKIEMHTRNPVVLMLVRSFLNPTRSFANLMRGSVPWNRDTRPGIWGNRAGHK
jgi:hypothetical protein